jgi:hypothetical protein
MTVDDDLSVTPLSHEGRDAALDSAASLLSE